jgi:hypothetical protein
MLQAQRTLGHCWNENCFLARSYLFAEETVNAWEQITFTQQTIIRLAEGIFHSILH